MAKEIRLSHSKYWFCYDTNKATYQVFRGKKDVTTEVSNNCLTDLLLAFVEQQQKLEKLAPELQVTQKETAPAVPKKTGRFVEGMYHILVRHKLMEDAAVESIKEVDGHLFWKYGRQFGARNESNRLPCWTITDIATGMSVMPRITDRLPSLQECYRHITKELVDEMNRVVLANPGLERFIPGLESQTEGKEISEQKIASGRECIYF